MTLWTVLPVKPFAEAKSRLGPALTPAERSRLASNLHSRTLELALRFARRRPVLVVSRAPEVLENARRHGAESLAEAFRPELNRALAAAVDHVAAGGGTRIMVVPSDLPLLEVDDLDVLDRAGREGVALAPDRHGRGTNALVWPLVDGPQFRFGPDSLPRHLAAAEPKGAKLVCRLGLSLDIDEEEDLDLWRRLGKPPPSWPNARRGVLVPQRSIALD